MAQTSTGARFGWWRTDPANEGLTLVAAPDLEVAAAPAAEAVGAQGVVPDPTRGLVPAATRDGASLAQGLEESLDPSQKTGNHAPAPTDLVLDPTSPNLARGHRNLVLVQVIGNQSHVPRAAPSQSQSGILVADPRRWILVLTVRMTRSAAAVQLPLSKMEKRSVLPNLLPARRPHRKANADLNPERNVPHLAQCPAQGLVHNLDHPLRIRCRNMVVFFVVFFYGVNGKQCHKVLIAYVSFQKTLFLHDLNKCSPSGLCFFEIDIEIFCLKKHIYPDF